nr:MAG TPA: hypothetical protein [Caudoviricetes sp.]
MLSRVYIQSKTRSLSPAFLLLESSAGLRRLLACLDLYSYQIKFYVILHFNLSSGYFIDLLIFKGKLRF